MSEKKLNWWNLKKNKCPKCGRDWARHMKEYFDEKLEEKVFFCEYCQFKIRLSVYKKIITNQTNKEIEDQRNFENIEQ